MWVCISFIPSFPSFPNSHLFFASSPRVPQYKKGIPTVQQITLRGIVLSEATSALIFQEEKKTK